ncbi:MAG TPA: hypothetical protein VMV92_12825 [Streptosporangiaceae bacterium]|nr:hypothetical protein [Streptosporangiaceae bacterium]
MVAHLLEGEMAAREAAGGVGPGALAEVMRRARQRLDGAFTLVAVDTQDPGAAARAGGSWAGGSWAGRLPGPGCQRGTAAHDRLAE